MSALGGETVFNLLETAMLRGPDQRLPHGGIAAPDSSHADRQLAFEVETRDKLLAGGHTTKRAHSVVLAQESGDIIQRLNQIAASDHIDVRDFVFDKQSLEAFVLSVPAKGAITRLRMTAHENPQFRWHVGDLNDMTALGMAAAYCDIVVAENQWGHILRRHQRHLRATVITTLDELPAHLLA